MKHLFDSSVINPYTEEYCNFSVGAPGPDLLVKCCQIFKDATNTRMDYEQVNNSYLFQYGPTAGLDGFRDSLATFLSNNYGSPVHAKDLILTAGASHGMHLLWTLLLDPHALVIVDEVTYMIALASLKNFPGFNVVSCPLQGDGPDLKALEEILVKYDVKRLEGGRFGCMYYTVPVFHNPTGVTFSESKSRQLIQLSRQFNFLIACDDVYNLLNYTEDDDTKVARMIALDDPGEENYKGTVISNGTFSKIFSPGVRVGWIEAPAWAVDVLENSGILKSGGSVNNYVSGIMATIMDNGKMQETLDYYRMEYEKRMRLACQILATELHPRVTFMDPRGGYFIWLVFPDDVDVARFNDRLREEYKVFGIPGGRFSNTNGSQNCLRLSVAFHRPPVIAKGIAQLCLATRELFTTKND